jgi:hypothetical protein
MDTAEELIAIALALRPSPTSFKDSHLQRV